MPALLLVTVLGSMEVMRVQRVTSSLNQEVMQKGLLSGKNKLFGLDSPYIQTENPIWIILNYIQ